jgi:hypothetical protein
VIFFPEITAPRGNLSICDDGKTGSPESDSGRREISREIVPTYWYRRSFRARKAAGKPQQFAAHGLFGPRTCPRTPCTLPRRQKGQCCSQAAAAAGGLSANQRSTRRRSSPSRRQTNKRIKLKSGHNTASEFLVGAWLG